jgi:hypothetical protein
VTARLAGLRFLFYIAVGITSLVLFGRATSGQGIAAQLAGIAQHATAVRVTVVLGMFECFSAVVLLLRGRMIPVALAWLGVLASVLFVVILPLQLAGLVGGPVTGFMWLPMLVFEVALALWLLIKGVAPAQPRGLDRRHAAIRADDERQ